MDIDFQIKELVPLHLVEKYYIKQVIIEAEGNKAKAARLLGIDRRTLYRKLDSYAAIEPDKTLTLNVL